MEQGRITTPDLRLHLQWKPLNAVPSGMIIANELKGTCNAHFQVHIFILVPHWCIFCMIYNLKRHIYLKMAFTYSLGSASVQKKKKATAV